MKKSAVILAILLITSNAFAIVDDTPNSVGFYWDANYQNDADIVDGVMYAPYMMGRVIITNPTFDTFSGVELALYAREDGYNLPMDAGIIAAVPSSMGEVVVTGGLPLCVYETAAPVITSLFPFLNFNEPCILELSVSIL